MWPCHALLPSFCLAMAALVSGCVSSARLPASLPNGGGLGTGLVFGSIGISATAPTIEMSTLQFRALAGDPRQAPGEFVFHSPVGTAGRLLSPLFDTPVDFSEPDAKGTLFVARLPAGDYALVGAAVENAPMHGWAAHVYLADPGAVPFRVDAGGTTYLGQFISHLRVGRDADRIPKVQGAFFVVGDKLERDLALLKQRGERPLPPSVINLAPRLMQIDNEALRRGPP